MNLASRVKITQAKAAQTSAGTEVTSDAIDMQGWDGILWLAAILTANAGNYIKAQQDSDSGFGTVQDLAGTKVVPASDADAAWLDIYKPSDRYQRLSIIRAGTNTATANIWAIQYSGRKLSVDDLNNVTNVIIGEIHATPAEGTA
jgi:hypothetical protein